jgi:hypothetical protein
MVIGVLMDIQEEKTMLNKSKHDEKLGMEILKRYEKEIMDAPASRSHHNNFKGGLLQHLENTLFFTKKYFPEESELHFLALVHDIGKCREYVIKVGISIVPDKYDYTIGYAYPPVDHIIHTLKMLWEEGIVLDDYELNAIQMHHGGWSPFKTDLCSLAVKLHFCDMMAVDLENREGERE